MPQKCSGMLFLASSRSIPASNCRFSPSPVWHCLTWLCMLIKSGQHARLLVATVEAKLLHSLSAWDVATYCRETFVPLCRHNGQLLTCHLILARLRRAPECSVMQLRIAQQLPYSDTCPPILAEFLHVKPGKGAAFVRSKLKNYLTGNTVEKTFRAGESVESALVERSPTQFTYADGDDVSSGADSSRWPLHGSGVLLWQTAQFEPLLK